MNQITWPTAFMAVGGFFAAAWAIRSFFRMMAGEKA